MSTTTVQIMHLVAHSTKVSRRRSCVLVPAHRPSWRRHWFRIVRARKSLLTPS